MKTTLHPDVLEAFPPEAFHLHVPEYSTGRFTYAMRRTAPQSGPGQLASFAEDCPVDSFFDCECAQCAKIEESDCPIVILVEEDGAYMIVLWPDGLYEMVRG
jgi:hypothetical protein